MTSVSELIRFVDPVVNILFILVLYFLSILSKRLGDVMGMKKYYYIYYIGMLFLLLNTIIDTHIIFAIGITFGLIAAIKYWGWLIKELVRG